LPGRASVFVLLAVVLLALDVSAAQRPARPGAKTVRPQTAKPAPSGAQRAPDRAAVLALARNFYLACAAAAFSLDPVNATGAGNLGAAIASYGEDLAGAVAPGPAKERQLKPYRDEAIGVYLYALSLGHAEALGGAGGLRDSRQSAVPLLVNLGNLYLDNGAPPKARAAFEDALRVQPESWPAHQGMAAYYLATGRKDLAEKELKPRECWPASMRRTAEAGEKTEEKTSPTVAESDSESTMEAKLAQLRKVEPATMADFIQDLDQSEANRLRQGVRNLALDLVYKAPDPKPLMQYGSLEAFIGRPAALQAQAHVPVSSLCTFTLHYSSRRNSSSASLMPAALTFSSRCLTRDVPGMGSITAERRSSHASAICAGVASCCFAIWAIAPPCSPTVPCCSGYHGMNAIPSRSQ
jgi:tetratricopeptide (TPR) repeat protein